jgi:hypothetical protein
VSARTMSCATLGFSAMMRVLLMLFRLSCRYPFTVLRSMLVHRAYNRSRLARTHTRAPTIQCTQ